MYDTPIDQDWALMLLYVLRRLSRVIKMMPFATGALNHALIYPINSFLLANQMTTTMGFLSLNAKTAIQVTYLQLLSPIMLVIFTTKNLFRALL